MARCFSNISSFVESFSGEQVKQLRGSKIQADLYERSTKEDNKALGISMKKSVRVFSNFAREKVVVLENGKLVLSFDEYGYADMPEHLLPILEREMRVRPGRYKYSFKEDEAFVPDVPAPVRTQVKELLEKITEEVEKPSEEKQEVVIPEKVVAVEKKESSPRRSRRRRIKKKKESEEK